ncbi:N-acetylmuramoyl-L-alanine amidase [Ruficoccus amylovorans]|uniref:N-acetylmuramoyl-L-alanine amidase n=1 Tax=Ruficoccus amylovorans TaxID=1804625 RepID=A0A842HDL2_9BACT|nr:N-acetylmuramoyl-L-alanine amidase [Ruficoccus amylovorans]MBC2594603.1 N-acetylmuramoyl-L-alanine amidase [Ruficoccus amylovorans]
MSNPHACFRPWALLPLLITAFLLIPSPRAAAQATINGTTYISLDTVAGQLGMSSRWIKSGEEAELKSQWTTMRFLVHKRWFFLNGERIYLGMPVASNRGQAMIAQRDYDTTIRPLLTPTQFEPVPKLYRIVIDPGHGGKDPGAQNTSRGVNEKTLTLDVAQRLKRKLEAVGYKVILTRDSDKYVSLGARPALANQVNADLFISLHFNAVDDPRVSGVETYAMTPPYLPSTSGSTLTASARKSYPGNKNDPWNLLAAYYLQTSMVRNLGATDRGLKRARFAVLKDLNCPGVLIEGGFLSNPAEAERLKTSAEREKLANSLLEGILLYQKKLNILRGKG